MAMKRFLILILAGFLVFSIGAQQTNPTSADLLGKQVFSQGKDHYQQARYQDAINSFRDLLANSAWTAYRGDAYFWVAKSLLAMGRLDDASRNFEFFITNYHDNANIPESLYLRGRILYLQSDYPGAIGAFAKFLEGYPTSSYVPNAYYWTGEALYSMGQLDEAQKMFQIVIQEFPTSFRIEAARYRVALVDLRKREGQLLELLKWSHQENIKNLEDFQKREKVYEEAIRSYQQRMANLASDDFRQEIRNLQQKADSASSQNDAAITRINDLNTQLREIQSRQAGIEKERDDALAQNKVLQGQIQKPLADAIGELERRQRLLDAKEQALAIKEQALKAPEDAK